VQIVRRVPFYNAGNTDVFACEVAPVLDVGDGERVGGVWVTHCGFGNLVEVGELGVIARRGRICKSCDQMRGRKWVLRGSCSISIEKHVPRGVDPRPKSTRQ
jgi:hypothetical protein